jgi:hypothetical protein
VKILWVEKGINKTHSMLSHWLLELHEKRVKKISDIIHCLGKCSKSTEILKLNIGIRQKPSSESNTVWLWSTRKYLALLYCYSRLSSTDKLYKICLAVLNLFFNLLNAFTVEIIYFIQGTSKQNSPESDCKRWRITDPIFVLHPHTKFIIMEWF